MGNYLAFLLIFISFVLFSACSETKSSNETAITKNAVPEVVELVTPIPYESDQITKANFQKISNGMTYSEVEIIFEDSGNKVQTDSNPDNEIEIYVFQTPDKKGRAVITFKDKKVIKKEQFDLK